jgi:hypothetical protein
LQTSEPFEGTVVASSSTLRRPLRRTADRNCGSAIERIAEMTNWRRSYRRDLVDRLSIALDQPPKAKRADLQNSVVGPLGQCCRHPAQHWYDLSNRFFLGIICLCLRRSNTPAISPVGGSCGGSVSNNKL